MAYYTRKISRQQDQRLNINEEYELMDWSERYGVSAEKIREAVKVVGDKVSDVVRYLLDGNKTNQLHF
jgi:5'-3' exonuclease